MPIYADCKAHSKEASVCQQKQILKKKIREKITHSFPQRTAYQKRNSFIGNKG